MPGVLIGEPDRWLGAEKQRGRGSACSPLLTGLIEGVVHPGGWTLTDVGLDRSELPVGAHGAARTLAAIEAQEGQWPRQGQQMGEVIVCPVLPAAGPDQLEMGCQCSQLWRRGGGEEMGRAFDRMEAASGRIVGREAEQREHAVDVEQQQGRSTLAGGLIKLSWLLYLPHMYRPLRCPLRSTKVKRWAIEADAGRAAE